MDIINVVLDEIIATIEALRNGNAIAAYAMYLDWKGDVNKLNSRDYSAACALFWYGIEDAGFELYCENDLRRGAFILAW